ncbi:phosphate acetyltransferase [Aquipuribacter nitratireducens]|uniref:Phosphate acetyltransferase n=1 Tax=Aquipuribacter nitratireducens TaxID=650104 RepID=A0ABW0GL28_9MICO
MSTALFLLSTEAESGKSALALALFEAMARRVARPAVFRPVTREGEADFVVDLLLSRLPEAARPAAADCVGVTYDEHHADPDATRPRIVAQFRRLTAEHDAVLVVGSDFTDVGAASELATNLDLAQDLAAPVVAVVTGRHSDGRREPGDVRAAADHALAQLRARHLPVVGLVANRCDPDALEAVRDEATASLREAGMTEVPLAVVPELPLLAAPTLRQIADATGAHLVSGDEADLDRAAVDVMVAAMTLPHMLERLVDQAVVIVPGDRSDVLVGTLAAAHADTFPTPSGLVLTGGFEPDPVTARLVAGFTPSPPVVVAPGSTFEVATVAAGLRGRMRAGSERKIEAALQLAAEHVPAEAWLDGVALAPSEAVTPVMFTHDLFERARADRRRIVLPEGTEPRVLRAAERVLRRGVADLVLLGDPDEVTAAAVAAGVDASVLQQAEVVDPVHDERRDRYAETYARLRAHRGVTPEQAHDVVTDVSYFGTLMVHAGEADGMVSGSVHTTAHTIRPAFEIIRTRPGVSVVSSVFFMLLPDRVLVYGDCAVVPSPTAEQLADIAVSSAGTAEAFGVEPRVAMLSYSTGTSGSGEDVDRVRTATALVRERRPELLVEGPLQYDAAVDPAVAATKLPDSPVAGRATVLVFPDLNTGNNTYKAVQRSAGATAVGPVLQGLNAPVNDLSRGATVDDIATTVAVTAVQAQETERSAGAAS